METTEHVTSAAAEEERSRPGGLVLTALTLGFAVIQLDVSVVNVAVKAIGTSLGGGVSGVQWVVDAYTLTFAALILSAGALGDRIGARRVLIAGFVLFIAASAACGAAPSIGVLIAARLVQGAGAAALGGCSLALLNHSFPSARERARAVGIWAAGGSAALAAGPVAGGLLIAAAGWRAIFFINLPLGAVGCWLTARYAAETPRARDHGVDLPGQAAAMVALAALAGATIWAGSRGFGAPAVLGGYGLAVLALAVFVILETRQARPMVPLSLFRTPAFSVTVATGFLINVVFYGLIFVFSLFLQRQDGLSPLAAGLAFVPVTVTVMVINVLSGRFPGARWFPGTRGAIAGGALLMAAGCCVIVAAPAPVAVPVVGLSVAGLGIGLIVPAITAALLGSVDRSWSGTASGTLTALRQTGSVLGVAVFGSLLAGRGITAGLHLACEISVGLAALVVLLSLGTARRGEGR
jgi:MFS transporter, DHA2 family, methylenomycin A resistance protein